MRHRKGGRKFNMDSSARKAMFRNMVTSLLIHGQIRTTTERAKELRKFADRVISIGKRAPTDSAIGALKGDEAQRARASRVHAIRRAKLWVNNDDAMEKLFGEYAERFQTRPGGYTRVVKANRRAGDNANMAIIQLVEAYESPTAPKKKKKATKAKKADEPTMEVAAAEPVLAEPVAEEPAAEEQPAEAPAAEKESPEEG